MMKKREAFTLIELLVVVSVIVLLMALLLPALHRARRQAQAVVCQSNLRQWGLAFAQYALDHDNRMPISHAYGNELLGPWDPTSEWDRFIWCNLLRSYSSDEENIVFCPMATKRHLTGPAAGHGSESNVGRTFMAWGPYGVKTPYGSYGVNDAVLYCPRLRERPTIRSFRWRAHGRGRHAGRIPVLLDGLWFVTFCHNLQEPPREPEFPFYYPLGSISNHCINRHDGGVNGLFLDGAACKVGLKELWTLPWRPDLDTAGPWTKAGGVLPEDWPQWMRGFKDY